MFIDLDVITLGMECTLKPEVYMVQTEKCIYVDAEKLNLVIVSKRRRQPNSDLYRMQSFTF